MYTRYAFLVAIMLGACMQLGSTHMASTKLEADAYHNFYVSTYPFFMDMYTKAAMKQTPDNAKNERDLNLMEDEYNHVPITPAQETDSEGHTIPSPERGMKEARDTYAYQLTPEQKVRLNNMLAGAYKPNKDTQRSAFQRTELDRDVERRIDHIRSLGKDPHHVRDCLRQYHNLAQYPDAFNKDDKQQLTQACNPKRTNELISREMKFFNRNAVYMPEDLKKYIKTVKSASNPRNQFIADNTSFARRWIQYPLEWVGECIGIQPRLTYAQDTQTHESATHVTQSEWKPKDYYYWSKFIGNVLWYTTKIALHVWVASEEQKRIEEERKQADRNEQRRQHTTEHTPGDASPANPQGSFVRQQQPEGFNEDIGYDPETGTYRNVVYPPQPPECEPNGGEQVHPPYIPPKNP